MSSLYFYPGGIAGANSRGEDGSWTGTIKRCVNYGSISSQEGSSNGMGSGGIAGSNSSYIDESANYGYVAAVQGAGGIAYAMEIGSVTNCYNRGTIYASSEQAGGLVTAILGRTGQCTLSTGYNAGQISSEGAAASLVVVAANMPGPITIDNIYNDSQVCSGLDLIQSTSMAPTVDEATVLDMTTAEIKSQDFADVLNAAGGTDQWVYDPNFNDGYPTFKWLVDGELSAVDKVTADPLSEVKVYGLDGKIVVEGADAAQVAVYSTSGVLLAAGGKATVSKKDFTSGIYIVSIKCDGATKNVKVAL